MVEMIERILRENFPKANKLRINLTANEILDRLEARGYEIVKKEENETSIL